MFMLFESHLKELLVNKNIKYLLLTPGFSVLNDYITSTGCFDEIEYRQGKNRNENIYRIYRVKKVETSRVDRLPLVGKSLKDAMYRIRKNDPMKYDYFQNTCICDLASLTPTEFAALIESVE